MNLNILMVANLNNRTKLVFFFVFEISDLFLLIFNKQTIRKKYETRHELQK